MPFEDDAIDDTARGQVLERMQNVTLPTGANWQIGANTTSTGEVFRYVITAPPSYKLEDLRALRGNRLEALSGDRKGQFSIRINVQYRICFNWKAKGPTDVEITDYH